METQLVVFQLAGESYGVPIDQVREINRYVEITQLPKAPPSVLGAINLREQVIPIISLRQRLGLPGEDVTTATRIIVSDIGETPGGFVVDAVTEVLRVDSSAILPPPPATRTLDSAFITGIGRVGERLIILLDLARVFDFSLLTEVA